MVFSKSHSAFNEMFYNDMDKKAQTMLTVWLLIFHQNCDISVLVMERKEKATVANRKTQSSDCPLWRHELKQVI